MGLVNKVVPLEQLEPETLVWCREVRARCGRRAAAGGGGCRGPRRSRRQHAQRCHLPGARAPRPALRQPHSPGCPARLPCCPAPLPACPTPPRCPPAAGCAADAAQQPHRAAHPQGRDERGRGRAGGHPGAGRQRHAALLPGAAQGPGRAGLGCRRGGGPLQSGSSRRAAAAAAAAASRVGTHPAPSPLPPPAPQTEEGSEGRQAYLEKRPPDFSKYTRFP
jgi:hypothetical protein